MAGARSVAGRETTWRWLWLGLLAMLATGPATAQGAGEVEFARGVGFVQTPGQAPRTLGKGTGLQQGDRLTTSEGATAIIRLDDGTRMTVRPNSELLLQQYQYRQDAADNSMVMQLFRGGFRAITGLIAKSSPEAARVTTRTATIGIRGTDFDARICGPADCKLESDRIPQKARASQVQASAKLVSAQGRVQVLDGSGQSRQLVDGGSIFPGETVETQVGTKAVIAFRDESRLTVGSGTRLKVDNFVFDEKAPAEGRFLVSLLQGSMRALTGLIGKANTRNVGFNTPTATLGIRGTGLDVACGSDAGCSFYTWLGSIEVTPQGQTALEVLQAGQGLFVGRDGIRPLTESPLPELQRPDDAPVDFKQLFSSGSDSGDQEGLYVFVRDGHIEVVAFGETVHLGRGETAFAAGPGVTYRLPLTPLFIDYDTVPLPDSKNPGLIGVLNDLGLRSLNICK
jgi:hypothetical protein